MREWLHNDLHNFSLKGLCDIEKQVQTMLECERLTPALTQYKTSIPKRFKKYNDIQTIQYSREKNNLYADMKEISLINNKHIPELFLKNSVKVRQSLLAGLIDTDGYLNKGTYEIVQKNKRLALDIVRLTMSLGYYTTWKEVQKTCTTTNATGMYIKISIKMDQRWLTDKTFHIPVILVRKKFNGTKFWFNPKIDENGNPIRWSAESTINWTHCEDLKLLNWIIQNNKERIQWTLYNKDANDACRSRIRDLYKKYKITSKSNLEKASMLLKIICDCDTTDC
jgi:hypothetical protein